MVFLRDPEKARGLVSRSGESAGDLFGSNRHRDDVLVIEGCSELFIEKRRAGKLPARRIVLIVLRLKAAFLAFPLISATLLERLRAPPAGGLFIWHETTH